MKYNCAGPGCGIEHSNPLAGETDPNTGQVVHFHDLACWGAWLRLNPRSPFGQLRLQQVQQGTPHRQMHGDGSNW